MKRHRPSVLVDTNADCGVPPHRFMESGLPPLSAGDSRPVRKENLAGRPPTSEAGSD